MFQYNIGLKFITVPSTITRIESNAFSNCFSLTGVAFIAGIKAIGTSMFSGVAFTSLTIPASVTNIGLKY